MDIKVDLQEILANLNDAQRDAVQAPDGPLLIFAGAGSGKTSVLTRRIVFLLKSNRAEPSQICALTFTNKAASEMKERVTEMLKENPQGMYIGTFHALGLRMLKQWDYAAKFGRSGRFSICDEKDQKEYVRRAVKAAGINLREAGLRLAEVQTKISSYKDEMTTPEKALEKAEEGEEVDIAKIYGAYEKELLAADTVDFDDLILLPVRLLKENPEILSYFQKRWTHFLVDEYQDTSRAQFELISTLSSKGKNLTVVGDDDQCLMAGTKILMDSLLERSIEDVIVGDKVLVPGETGYNEGKVVRIHKGHASVGIRIATESGKALVSTLEHTHLILERQPSYAVAEGEGRFFVREASLGEERRVSRFLKRTNEANFRMVPATDVKVGMTVWNSSGKPEKVTFVELTLLDFETYDLDISEVHCLVANGILTHNSIYGWRGADVRNILSFKDLYPGAKIVKLEQNYRSHQGILNTAHSLILNNKNREDKRLWSERIEGPTPLVQEFLDEKGEAIWITKKIVELRDTENFPYGEMVILFRTNAQSRAFEESLINEGIPYQIVNGTRFYDRKEIKDVIAYLTLLWNPKDVEAFLRSVQEPTRGVGSSAAEKAIAEANRTGKPVLDILRSPALLGSVSSKARRGLQEYSRVMEELLEEAKTRPLRQLIEEVLVQSGYLEALDRVGGEDSERKIANLAELIGLASEYDLDAPPQGLERFLENARLITEFDEVANKGTGVTLITAHMSKGLEYGVVFMAGMEEGIFPHRNSVDEEGIEEERRLAYVGITRAKDRLYVTHCQNRHLFGQSENFNPSRFIEEIRETVVNEGLSRRSREEYGKRNPPLLTLTELD